LVLVSYWINTISKDHVKLGVEGGFTQANHGKDTMLKRLKKGDWIVFYSPKTNYKDGEPVQAFTAIGQVKDDELYQFEVDDRMPWRRNFTFYDCEETPIKPLIDDLSFITNKTNWGFKFHFGMFQIPEEDFTLIKNLMLKS
jgi:predicted RNA-binding protein